MIDVNGISLAESTATTHGASRLIELLRCPRSHHLKYHLNVRSRPRPDDAEVWETEDPSNFAVGRIVHSILEYVQRCTLGAADPAGLLVGRWEEVIPAVSQDLGAKLEASRLMAAYWEHYGLDNAGWHRDAKILAVEELLEGSIGGVPISARADAILDVGGKIQIPDHKSRARAFPRDLDRYRAGLRTREQFLRLSYLVAERYDLDYYPDVMINGIIKTRVPSFERLIIDLGEAEIERWIVASSEIADEGLESMTYPNFSACAPEVGSRCWAFKYCHGTELERERYFTKGASE